MNTKKEKLKQVKKIWLKLEKENPDIDFVEFDVENEEIVIMLASNTIPYIVTAGIPLTTTVDSYIITNVSGADTMNHEMVFKLDGLIRMITIIKQLFETRNNS